MNRNFGKIPIHDKEQTENSVRCTTGSIQPIADFKKGILTRMESQHDRWEQKMCLKEDNIPFLILQNTPS